MASLHYLFAPMNASKSAQLLMCAHNYEERGKKVITIKPTTDTRDGVYIRSRALNMERKVDIAVRKEDSLALLPLADVFLVDEAQFLTSRQVDNLRKIVDDFRIPVMCYGIKTDAFTHLFEGSKRLFEVADKFQEFKTICPCCGGKAIFNMRLDENEKPVFEGDQEQVGHNYLPVCSKHYYELKEKYND